MKIYKSVPINQQVYYINDEDHDSCYLIIGKQKALLMDAGLFQHPLMPTIKSLTDKPVMVACSHGHLDHTGNINEFNEIYLSHLDQQIYFDNEKLSPGFNTIDFNLIKDIKNHQVFDLGDIKIEAVLLSGHTPGSLIFVDKTHHLIFTGDAIGSGCGVWMQLFHSLKINQYLSNLNTTIDYLESIGVDDSWKFWGGHNLQERTSRISDYNRLDFTLMKDMADLCKQLLSGKLQGEVNQAPTFDGNQSYYVAYRKAEMIYQKNSLK